jgi:hypothetical protein
MTPISTILSAITVDIHAMTLWCPAQQWCLSVLSQVAEATMWSLTMCTFCLYSLGFGQGSWRTVSWFYKLFHSHRLLVSLPVYLALYGRCLASYILPVGLYMTVGHICLDKALVSLAHLRSGLYIP